jgi:enamine deaminase RidA (YjgF/YER057c/UK114 family)
VSVEREGGGMGIERVNPEELAEARGFSHAVVGHGTIVFLAGQTALDTGGRIVGTTVAGQFEQALANLLTALRAAGGRAEQLASLTVYVTDMEGYPAAGGAGVPGDGGGRGGAAVGCRGVGGGSGVCHHLALS